MLPHLAQNPDLSLKALCFTTLGDLYLCMGDTKNAGDYFMESIEEARKAADPLLMADILNNLGNFLSSTGEYVKALAAYEESLMLIEEKGEGKETEGEGKGKETAGREATGKETASRTLINIVRLRHYNRLGYSELCEEMNMLRSLTEETQKEHEDADQGSNQGSNKNWFISLRGKTQDFLPDEESFFPSSLSGDYTGDTMEAIEKTYQTINTLPASYQKAVDMICLGILALDIQNDLQKESPGYASKLNDLQKESPGYGSYGSRLNGSKIRDIASKLFIDASNIAGELGNLGLLAYSHGYLGQVYESEGRYQEALTLTRKAIFAAQQGYFPEILYLWQWQLGRVFEAVGEKDKALLAYDDAIATLKPIQKEFFTGYRSRKEVFNERVRPVYTSYAGLILKEAQDAGDEAQRKAKLKKARDTMEGLKIAELVDYFEDECLRDQYTRSVPLDRTPSRTALLYPIILNDRLSLLLTLPEGMQQTTIMVNSQEVFQTIKRLQTELQIQNSSSYLKDAQRVYEWIIHPIEDKLMAEGIDTLVMVPDGVFRLIPFAALYDGNSYLIEKYALVTLPSITLTDIEPLNGGVNGGVNRGEETRVLLSGLSEARQGFPPLPNVQKEIDNIHTLLGGTILKDNTFTIGNLKQELDYNACRIVHVASHGVFDASARESFLLAYDDKITMDSLAEMIQGGVYHGSPIGLLALSACQTAKGDERAALGLGGIAVKAGARSVIATLWSVDDESTSLLMKEFYNQLKNPGMSKAKALQTAQMKILDGAAYRHPFFWAPFLLIGNWL
jgi:CHAT domain-containing protein